MDEWMDGWGITYLKLFWWNNILEHVHVEISWIGFAFFKLSPPTLGRVSYSPCCNYRQHVVQLPKYSSRWAKGDTWQKLLVDTEWVAVSTGSRMYHYQETRVLFGTKGLSVDFHKVAIWDQWLRSMFEKSLPDTSHRDLNCKCSVKNMFGLNNCILIFIFCDKDVPSFLRAHLKWKQKWTAGGIFSWNYHREQQTAA